MKKEWLFFCDLLTAPVCLTPIVSAVHGSSALYTPAPARIIVNYPVQQFRGFFINAFSIYAVRVRIMLCVAAITIVNFIIA